MNYFFSCFLVVPEMGLDRTNNVSWDRNIYKVVNKFPYSYILEKLKATKYGRDVLRFLSRSLACFSKSKYPVVVNSIPKAGTNLLLNVVLSIPGMKLKDSISRGVNYWGFEAFGESKEAYISLFDEKIYDLSGGMVYFGHNPYLPELARFLHRWRVKHILIIRDPRDYVISLARYISDPSVKHIRAHLFSGISGSEKILRAILGIGEGRYKFDISYNSIPNVVATYRAYEGWLSDKNTLCVRYEDFVDENGISKNVHGTIEKILRYLEVEFDDDLVNYIISEGMRPEKSHTFRVGRSGQWKKILTREHLRAFRKIGGDEILRKYGYAG